MKNRILLMIPLALAILLPSPAWAQFPPTADAYINETTGANFGAAATLQVANPNFESFIQFDLSSTKVASATCIPLRSSS